MRLGILRVGEFLPGQRRHIGQAALLKTVPVIVADAGYGRSVSFRLALEERGWSYVMAVDPKEVARLAAAEPA
ncbi:transposase, partial [Streptomyces tendae]